MKSLTTMFVALLLLGATRSFAQQNYATYLKVTHNSRDYYVNRGITGATEDSQGINYLLLHPIYTGTLLTDHFVMGKITGVRGAMSAYNRKFTVEVNTSSAYNANLGTIISYNEPSRLVTLVYNGASYLALEIAHAASLNRFSFTGYAQNETLQLVTDNVVSNIQVFQVNPITTLGAFSVGTTSTSHMLNINAPGASIMKATLNNINGNDAYLDIINNTSVGNSFSPGIRGRGVLAGRIVGLSLIGEVDDLTPITNDPAAAVVIDGRTKTALSLSNANIFAINSYGVNKLIVKADGSMGIGTSLTHGNKLAVNGTILATKVKVKAFAAWPDYVFHHDYQLRNLPEVEQFILQHKHLPDIPSAAEMKDKDVDLSEMDSKLLRKIEELMLYTIQQQKEIEELKSEVKQLKARP